MDYAPNITYEGAVDFAAKSRIQQSLRYNSSGSLIQDTSRCIANIYALIDDLTLTYDGNHLTSVRDEATDPTYNNAWNFVDGADNSVEYEYDANGNVTKDLNRNIWSIQYNSLNLPSKIEFTDGKAIRYTYSADGHKLRAVYTASIPATTKTVDYCGNLIFENSQLQQINVEGGYVTYTGSMPAYHFFIKDHLGNNRMVIHPNGLYMQPQVNNYYPYGGLMANSTNHSQQRFKYNGKEFDRMNGLDWYDYGARWQDPATGRWHSIDPLCEKYYNVSPYVYCHNNPVMLMDSDGRDDYYDEHGIYLGTNQAETDNIYISPEGEFSKLADGRYVVGLNSRIALNDADLKAEAYSKIFTNSLKLAGFNTDNLVDGKIQVTVWDFEGGSKITENYTDKANDVGDALATTDREHSRGALITAYVWPKGTGEREIYSTRSNVVNELRDHEYNGHYVMGYSHDKGTPDPVYLMQKNSSSWNKTTTQFKEYTNKVIKQNGW